MTTSVNASSELINRVLPPGPPPLQSSIQWKAHKDKGKLGKAHQCLLQGQRNAESRI